MTNSSNYIRETAAVAAVFLAFPLILHGEVEITEVMYDLEGADSGREWVEVRNNGTSSVNLDGWRFNDGSNHVLNPPPENGGTGSLVLPAGGLAILAADAEVFLSEYSGFSGAVIDTVMSLNNTAETIALLDQDGVIVDEVSYQSEDGAAGDGNTLHRNGDEFAAGAPTPGAVEGGPVQVQENPDTNSEPSGGNVLRELVIPTIAVDGGSDRTLVVGADSLFRAASAGTKGEPLLGARVIWNFGDGTMKEGEQVFHHYRYPGRYVVSVSASVGKFSALDRFIATALPADVYLAAANGDYIELENRSTRELDLSGWFLRAGGRDFELPAGTVLLAGASVRFPAIATHLSVVSVYDAVLLYPNGQVAARYEAPAERAVVSSTPARSSAPPEPPQAAPAPVGDLAPAVAGDVGASAAVVGSDNRQVAALGTAEPQSVPWVWLLAVLGVVGVGVVAVSIQRSARREADEYTIIE